MSRRRTHRGIARSSPRVRDGLLNLTGGQAGFTLVEELVALALVALGLVLLIAMITTGTMGVTVLADHVSAETLGRSQLELIKDAAYESDPGSNPYPEVSASSPYAVDVDIEYWDAVSESFGSTQTGDGLQRITVTVERAGDDVLSLETYKADR